MKKRALKLLVLMVCVLALGISQTSFGAAPTAVRSVDSDTVMPGGTITVTVTVDLDDTDMPSGAIINEANSQGWDQSKKKWLLSDITGNLNDQDITYTITVPADAADGTTVDITGTIETSEHGLFDGSPGTTTVTVQAAPPPDADGDGVPDDIDECPDQGGDAADVDSVGCLMTGGATDVGECIDTAEYVTTSNLLAALEKWDPLK